MKIKIREIIQSDFRSITNLSTQLGYQVYEEFIESQIKKIVTNPDHHAFVALKNDIIVGYIHCFLAVRLTSSDFLEICGLVVDKEQRGNGIGSILVKYVEANVMCKRTRVRCNKKRELAHRFYEKLNYSEKKEQKIFEKIFF